MVRAPTARPRAAWHRRLGVLVTLGCCGVAGCANATVDELQARGDSLSAEVERLVAVNDSLDDALAKANRDAERWAGEAKFWAEQSEGWRVIAEGGVPSTDQRRR